MQFVETGKQLQFHALHSNLMFWVVFEFQCKYSISLYCDLEHRLYYVSFIFSFKDMENLDIWNYLGWSQRKIGD